jgi:hypothetical protein
MPMRPWPNYFSSTYFIVQIQNSICMGTEVPNWPIFFGHFSYFLRQTPWCLYNKVRFSWFRGRSITQSRPAINYLFLGKTWTKAATGAAIGHRENNRKESHVFYSTIMVLDFFDEMSNIAFIYQMITVNYIWKHLVFAYPKRERYYISSLCFEMVRQMTLSTELSSVDSY